MEAETPSNTTPTLPIKGITVGKRYRKELGDINDLAASIREVGLLHPIVIDENSTLIAGHRRLEACKQLGWTEVPVRMIRLEELARGEYAENVMRKKFTPSEMAAISKALGIKEQKAARNRLAQAGPSKGRGRKKTGVGKLPEAVKGRAKDKVAKAVGTSRRTLEKVEAVIDAAEDNPSLVPLVDEMDRTGKVEPAYRKVKEAQAGTPVQTKTKRTTVDLRDKGITVGDFVDRFPGTEQCFRGRSASEKVLAVILPREEGRPR